MVYCALPSSPIGSNGNCKREALWEFARFLKLCINHTLLIRESLIGDTPATTRVFDRQWQGTRNCSQIRHSPRIYPILFHHSCIMHYLYALSLPIHVFYFPLHLLTAVIFHFTYPIKFIYVAQPINFIIHFSFASFHSLFLMWTTRVP